MKKLFTLFAFLAVFMGAKAEWVTDYTIDYSTKTAFPFYVMGYVPEWVDGVMTDYGADYRYATQADLDGDGDGKWKDGETSVGTVKNEGGTEYQKVTGAGPYWHQYIIAADVPMELDVTYTVKAVVKSTAAVNANLQFGNWGSLKETGVTIPQSDSFQEVEWEVSGCLFSGNGFICIQPGTSTAVIEWKSLTVSHNQKEQKPVEWVELLTNGDAGKSWQDLGLADVAFNDPDNSFKVCAWGKVNQGEPFPATIEDNVFVVHATDCPDPTADASAWDNQFWIMSTKELKVGMTYKVHFKYKASQNAKTNTQMHSIQPSDYLHWAAIGDVTFTNEWQEFDLDWKVGQPQNDRPIYSIAFNLNAEVKTATDFYFDDLSIKEMKLDEGYFVAGANTDEGIEYDLDNAIPFEGTGTDLVATVGAKGAYVNEIMISTVRGNDAAFKANTLKPSGAITNDPDNWMDYAPASLAKLKLPGSGIWKVYLDLKYSSMAFEMIEGTINEPIDVVTNNEVITINGKERVDMQDNWNGQTGELEVKEEADNNPNDEHGVGGEGHTGQAWDNQFWIVANRELAKGEVTHLKFKYKASKDAKTTTQCHKDPGGYLHWAAIGDVTFTTEWQEFDNDFTVPNEADGMKSIAFNMAEIKEACVYELKDFEWYLSDGVAEGKTWENLINGTGKSNFFIKEGAGTEPYAAGITNVVDNKKASAVIYNLSGQRVSKDYKGIVVSNGRKYIAK